MDGPVGIFPGGPLRSGEQVAFADLDWNALDALHDLELEIVGAASPEIARTGWLHADPTS